MPMVIHTMKYTRKNAAFTLVEILIVVVILGTLAAVVIPQFSKASQDANTSSLLTTLDASRRALERYAIDHNGDYPTSTATLWNQLTGTTDPDGTVNASGSEGPYLVRTPVNPFTGSSTVTAIGAGTATDGFEYDPTLSGIKLFAVGFNETTQTYTAP